MHQIIHLYEKLFIKRGIIMKYFVDQFINLGGLRLILMRFDNLMIFKLIKEPVTCDCEITIGYISCVIIKEIFLYHQDYC